MDGIAEWQKQCCKAVLEADREKLARLAAVAEAAMFLRSQELEVSSNERGEKQDIHNAMSGLSILKREFPSPRD